MATFAILDTYDNYQTIEVKFADQTFVQTVVSTKVGDELAAQLQNYADEYEAAWLANS
jgi:hypothetical protein